MFCLFLFYDTIKHMANEINLILILCLIFLWFFGKIKSDKFPSILKNFPANFLLFIGLLFLSYSIFSGLNYFEVCLSPNVSCDELSFAFYFFVPLLISIILLLWSFSIKRCSLDDLNKQISKTKKISIILGLVVSFIAFCFILLFSIINISYIASYFH